VQVILEFSKLTALIYALKMWFIFRYSLTACPEHAASLFDDKNEMPQTVPQHGSFPTEKV
jgi:hypothetical protein